MNNYSEFRKALKEAAPLYIWEEAENQAKRSTLGRHKTGAVIFNKYNNIVNKGCSHHRAFADLPSCHAETHAIENSNGHAEGNNLLIVTLTKGQNYARSSRPCIKCLLHMNKIGINEVIYAEMINDGTWLINQETPLEMLNRASRSWNRLDSFAKNMRLVYEDSPV